jgi:hypothetical protein
LASSGPVAYISYAWGDDTPEGKEREAIVNDLCRSFAQVGIVIGRDKNEVKDGDSIEAFGKRIAKAQLILAVISHESLRSKWCMLYELFEAYTRCGNDGKEFSDRVVALVLEDAETDLDEQNMTPLIEWWKQWKKNYNRGVDAADRRRRRSLESRKVLTKCGDMIECLPDMLLAINKIAMPRGSAAIRDKDFGAIRAYVQEKLSSAADEIPPAPAAPDLKALQTILQQLAQQHAALSPLQLHACWHGAIQFTWPQRTAASLFPQLASVVPLKWADLQAFLSDPNPWLGMDAAQIEILFDNFQSRLSQAASGGLSQPTTSTPPALAVLIKATGDRSPDGHPAYRCHAVLRIPLAEGGSHYEQVEPAADHLFCFHPHKERPTWLKPGVVLGRLWQAAKTRLTEQGRIDREPLLDLFLPRSLFDEDWTRLELEDGSEDQDLVAMATTFYRLRSIDRWTHPDFLLYNEHFQRKHEALEANAGYWKLFAEDPLDLHEQLSGSRSPGLGQPETVAILRLGSLGCDLRGRTKFYRSALESAAPVVLWLHPSVEGQPVKDRNQQVAQIIKALNLQKPTKTKHLTQEVRCNPFELPTQKQGLPRSLVALIEDRLDMDPERPATPRLISVAQQEAPSLGYGSG